MKTYGEAVKEKMRAKRLTYKGLALMCGLSAGTIFTITNHGHIPSIKTQKKLDEVLNINPSEYTLAPNNDSNANISKQVVNENTESTVDVIKEGPEEEQSDNLTPANRRTAIMCKILGIEQYEPFLIVQKEGLYRFSKETLERWTTVDEKWYSNDTINELQYNLFLGSFSIQSIEEIAKK